jgi:plasmid stabilization system protein ParE
MIYTVVILPEAEDDIIDAFTFIQADAPMNAERWLHGLYEAIATLETFPSRYALARENDDVPQELRQMIYKSHRVIFEIRPTEVHVLHVRHAAQDNLPPPGENQCNKEND